jgi:hypothetical protein
MLTESARTNILASILETIEEVSSKGYQKMVWIRGEGPWVDDFDEAVNYFVDAAGDVIDRYQEFKLTEEQYQILKTFRDKFKVFADENDYPELFIDTPEWTKVVNRAKEVLHACSSIKYNSKLPVVNEWVKQQEKRSSFEQGG